MKNLKALAALSVTTSLLAGAPIAHAGRGAYAFNTDEVSQVAPAFMHYSHDVLCKLWERPELSPRDRSIVTLAALISCRSPNPNCWRWTKQLRPNAPNW